MEIDVPIVPDLVITIEETNTAPTTENRTVKDETSVVERRTKLVTPSHLFYVGQIELHPRTERVLTQQKTVYDVKA